MKLPFLLFSFLVVIAMTSMVTAYIPLINYENNVLYYLFNNQSIYGENNTLIVDLSGNNYDSFDNISGHIGNNATAGNLLNLSIWNNTAGYNQDGAFEFNGINNYFTLPNPQDNSLNLSNFTIQTWFRTNNVTALYQFILSQDAGGATGTYEALRIWIASNKLQFSMFYYNSSYGLSSQCDTPLVVPNKWIYVVVRFNGTHAQTFLNGTKCTTSITMDGTQPLNARIVNNNLSWYIGKGRAANPRYMNGSIDDLFIWNVSLSDNEIYNMYANYIPINLCNDSIINFSGCMITSNVTWNNTNYNLSGNINIQSNQLNIINNSNINFNTSSIGIISSPGIANIINITNSNINWTNHDSGNEISSQQNNVIYILNSTINGIRNIGCILCKNITIDNSTFTNFGYGILNSYYIYNLSITNSNFINNSGYIEAFKFKGISNLPNNLFIFTNNYIYNMSYSNIFVYNDHKNIIFTYNRLNISAGHGLAFPSGNNSYVAYNKIDNVVGYLIDFYRYGNNHLVEYNNISNGSSGIMFSMQAGSLDNSKNLTSRNNIVSNLRSGYAIYFNTVVGGKSNNDIINDGTPSRCFSASTNSKYINFTDGYCNVSYINTVGMYVNANTSDILFKNIKLDNLKISFNFTNTTNITLTNVSYNDVGYISNGTNITLNNLTNYLALNCSSGIWNSKTIKDNSGSLIVNTNATECLYFYNDFNITDNVNRYLSPISFSSSTSTSKILSSNLSSPVNVTVVIDVDRCSGWNTYTYNGNAVISSDCSNNQATFNSLEVEPGDNTFLIHVSDSGKASTCDSIWSYVTAPLLFMVVIIVLMSLYVILGLLMQNEFYGGVLLTGIVILFVIGLFIMLEVWVYQGLC